MRADAHLGVSPDGRGATRISRLRSEPPLVLRPTVNTAVPLPDGTPAGAVTVSLAASAAGPLGGDRLRLEVEVAAGAVLVLRTVAATVVLPGPHGQRSRSETVVRVAKGGSLIWLPEPIIAAHGCDHETLTRIVLDTGACVLAREELILGRHGESPGAVRQRLRVTVGERPLHDNELDIGPGRLGWQSPAVTGGRKAVGSALLVTDTGRVDMSARADVTSAILPLSDSATLVTALADDAPALRRALDGAVSASGLP